MGRIVSFIKGVVLTIGIYSIVWCLTATNPIDAWLHFFSSILNIGIVFVLHHDETKEIEINIEDLFDAIVEEIERKAKSGFDVVHDSDQKKETCNIFDGLDRCYQCSERACKFFNKKQWVNLEDVLSILQQIKHNLLGE